MAAEERWSGKAGFILAAIGSAIGLGSIWKFPYEVGSGGGGPFLICYILGLIFIVLPLLAAELAIGRRGRMDAAASFAQIARSAGYSQRWGGVGALGVASGFLILSFYSVIGGWTLSYAVDAVTHGVSTPDAAASRAQFDALLASPLRMLVFHLVFMALAGTIVAFGISGGIEAACRVLMPLLMLIVTTLAVYSLVIGDAWSAVRFLFMPGFQKLSARIALDAVGLGFFSIGVGLSLMVTYAAYANEGENLRQVAIVTLLGDTAVSLLAGLTIFPIVFAQNLEPSSGPGLLFITLPVAFGSIPLGSVVAVAFYLLLFLAAIASAMAMLELCAVWLKRRLTLSRGSAVLCSALACWVAGLATVFSFSSWPGWYPLRALPGFQRSAIFDLLDFLTSNLLLPLGGILVSLFAGWIMPEAQISKELKLSIGATRGLCLWLRYGVPAMLALLVFAQVFK